MKTCVSIPGVGGNLITVQSGYGGHVRDQVQHGIGRVVFRHHRGEFGEISVGLDGQLVDRDVRRVHCQGQAHVLGQAVQCLARQRVHDVQVEGVKRLRRLFHSRNGLRRIMHPAQGFEVCVVKTLHADRQARHAGTAEGAKTVFFEGARVGLQRDFTIGRQFQARADVAQQAVNRLR